jgi:ubiquinol-cytochrome c reductase cytochrome b subunit
MKTSFPGWLFVFALIAAAPVAHASSRSQREHGAELFKANGCVHCHTINKVGGNKGPDLSGVGRTAPPAAMRKQIVDGGKGMPPFGEILQPKELDDLISYLRSCTFKPQK